MTLTPANDNNQRPACFDQLILDYQPFIYKRCRHEQDVEAMAQEITLRALEKWHQYKHDRRFSVWLSFMCRDVLREQKPRHVAPMLASSVAATQEYTADIRKVMSRLTRREARAMTLVATGYAKVDTCKKMRLSSEGLNVLLERARTKICAMFATPDTRVGGLT